MSKKSNIEVGTISGKDIFMKRKGKLNRTDDVVKMGTGIHTEEQFKEKNRQREKNALRELCR